MRDTVGLTEIQYRNERHSTAERDTVQEKQMHHRRERYSRHERDTLQEIQYRRKIYSAADRYIVQE